MRDHTAPCGYTFTHAIGKGSYGTVYAAKRTDDDARVAIKVFECSHDDTGIHTNILREVAALNATSGQDSASEYLLNRVKFVSKPCCCVILPMCGPDVNIFLRKHPECSPECRQLIIAHAIRGIQALHALGFMHRDVKPHNLLLDEGRRLVKLSDFGLARRYVPALDQGRRFTLEACTIWYRPPELLLGDTKYTPRVDVWSLGTLAVEVMTGEPLFPCSRIYDMLVGIFQMFGTPTAESWPAFNLLPDLHAEFPRFRGRPAPCLPDSFVSQSSEDVVATVRACMQCNPSLRPSSDELARHSWVQNAPCMSDVPFEAILEKNVQCLLTL